MLVKKAVLGLTAVVVLVGGIVVGRELFIVNSGKEQPVSGDTSFQEANPVPAKPQSTKPSKSLADLVKEYGELPLADAHNHDAGGYAYMRMVETWKRTSIDRIVLFGNVSDPSAIDTDATAWKAYEEYPELVIPFFSGINLKDASSLEVVKKNLEKGYFGIGEIAAASVNSPALRNVPWKTDHPMDGFLPQIYELAAQYKAPLLLHIDPPSGGPIYQLEEALEAYPHTNFIFAHANAYNSPDNIRRLLQKHPNLYADFFAGFTVFNPESSNKLEHFIPVMKEFPDRFMLSTDSGYGLKSEELAIEGMYRLIDELGDKALARKIAYDNLDALIKFQPATAAQLEAIRNMKQADGQTYAASGLTKVEAAKLLLKNASK
ncbi:amidohydrolase family protein [Paenibacillus radicis (ex Xue et al. 2023)]|uniref:Amidohydrolase family protein n=1 Tax=Paenibacillus radicis (ex Xue et al. 2023) TaxID=2972489 RepID=A0ABT1YPU7_9BACL|nr:amidohydrolase family protein [Paenibacillus radicis (ex Xue et al. 2023)]MCR8635052.1 amidohydrolase family protein [Paenibacillus radicis (ex Xue et al. 2023)]